LSWTFPIREELKLRLFENRVVGRIFGHKREEVAGGWRRLHNEERHNLHASQNILRGGNVARRGELRNAYKILVGKPEWKRPLGRPRRIWENNILMALGKIGWKVWIRCIYLKVGTNC
jgi:hypothetical protein